MVYSDEERAQLMQLADFIRRGKLLYPKKVIARMYGMKPGEACVLGCALAIINPKIRDHYLNGEDACAWDTLNHTFPVLKTKSPNVRGNGIDDLCDYIWSLNDDREKNLTVEKIANIIEELANTEELSDAED